MPDNKPWSDIFEEAAAEWVDKEAAAQLLEDTKSSVLAEKQALLGNIAVNKAEQIVKGSPDWRRHLESIVEARRAANQAKVRLEVIRMKFSEWSSEQANKRAEMKLI